MVTNDEQYLPLTLRFPFHRHDTARERQEEEDLSKGVASEYYNTTTPQCLHGCIGHLEGIRHGFSGGCSVFFLV